MLKRIVCLAGLFSLIVLSAYAAPAGTREDGTYTNSDLGISFTAAPEEFTLRTSDFKFDWTGAQCEIVGKDEKVGGVLVYFDSAMKVEKYANWRESSWKDVKDVKNFTRVREEKLSKNAGEWLIREHKMDYTTNDYYYVSLYIAKGRHNFELVLWVPETVWDEYKDTMYAIVNSVEYGGTGSSKPVDKPISEPKDKSKPSVEVAGGEIQDGVYTHKDLSVRFTASPDDFEIRLKNFRFDWAGTLCEIEGPDNIGGVLVHYTSGMKVDKYADWREESWRTTQDVKSYERLKEEKPKKGSGTWLRREGLMSYKEDEFHYLTTAVADGAHNFELSLWVTDQHWSAQKDKMYRIARSLEYGALSSSSPADDSSRPSKAKDGEVYRNDTHRLQLTVPAGWTMRKAGFTFSIPDTLLEFQQGDEVGGALGFSTPSLELKAYIAAFSQGLKGESQSFQDLGETKLAGGAVRRDYIGETSGVSIHFAVLFKITNNKNYFLAAWTSESNWAKFEDETARLLESLTFD